MRVKSLVTYLFIFSLTLFFTGCIPEPDPVVEPGIKKLSIPPTLQQTEVWCWAATAEMVFRHYNLPNLNVGGNYQCGIVAAWFGTQGFPQCLSSCGLCTFPVGPMSNQYRVITEYGEFIRSIGGSSRILSAKLIFKALTALEIQKEIDSGRPVIIGINTSGAFALPNNSEHIALLIGYDFGPTGQYVIVNDPFPFNFFPYNQYPHPYLTRGGQVIQSAQYRIPLQSLYGPLQWANTIYEII